MNAIKTLLAVVAAWLVSQLSATATVGVASAWLLSDSFDLRANVFIIILTVAFATFYSVGSAIMYLLNVKMWLATLILTALTTFAFLGMINDEIHISQQPFGASAMAISIIATIGLVCAFASSFSYYRTRQALLRW